jgi:16S rRNA processing protein RimM
LLWQPGEKCRLTVAGSESNEVRALTDAEEDAWVELGRVVRPHGLEGKLLVHLHGDDADNLTSAEVVALFGKLGRAAFRPQCVEQMGQLKDGRARVRLSLGGLASREAAETWTGARVGIPEGALQPLPEGEFYWRELLGLRCRVQSGAALGVVEEIWPTRSNDVLVVRDGTTQLLIPALRGVVARVDREAGELWINPPRGLLEED